MSPGDSSVLFRALPAPLRLAPAQRKFIRSFADKLASDVAGNQPFTCLITSDKELRELNQQFLGHDYATDVLSFPSLEGAADLGELAISVERAAAQAADAGHSTLDEICILMLHGVLHLTGHDHEIDHGEMTSAESHWRARLELPLSLLERAAIEVTR